MRYDFFKCHLIFNYSEKLAPKYLVVFRDLIQSQWIIDECLLDIIDVLPILYLKILLNAWDAVFNQCDI